MRIAERTRSSWMGLLANVAILVLGAAAINTLWDASDESRYRKPDVIGIALVVAQIGALLFRKRQPILAVAISLGAGVLLADLGFSRWVGTHAIVFGIFAVAIAYDWPVTLLASVASGALVWAILRGDPYISGATSLAAVLVVVPSLAGLLARFWRNRSHSARERSS